MQLTGIESNIWKYFMVNLTNRRNFIPILAVYYLMLPDTYANEIGLYTGIGYAASMLMQMPSGYIADRFGQKNTLIIAKLFLIASSILFITADGFWMFSLGAICMSLGADAFTSGTMSSFLKGTLEKLGKGDQYRQISSRITGDVALVSVVIVVLLPLLTTIDIRIPLYVGLALDICGLAFALSLSPVHMKIAPDETRSIRELITMMRGTGFFPYAIWAAVITGFLFADNVYRSPYLVELGYPLAYIGLVMGGSRLVWWAVGRSIHIIERYISFQRLILIELCLFPLYYITAGYISNPWILGVVFSLIVGWFWGRNEVYTDHFINCIPDSRYRATVLSMKHQLTGCIQIAISFGIAGVMGISYQLGFQVLGIVMFVMLSGVYWFGIRKN